MSYDYISSIISKIYDKYDEIYDIWIEEIGEDSINLKKTNVEYFTIGNNIEYINKYRNCISNNSIEFIDELNKMNVASRIKTNNSFNSKLDRYALKSDKDGKAGKFPIIKCLNDIFGTRIIVSDNNIYNDIIEKLKDEYSESRVYLKEEKGYIGVHFYFKRDNKMLPWELQIWRECDEISNKESHRIYKQGYTDWEELNKDFLQGMNEIAKQIEKIKELSNNDEQSIDVLKQIKQLREPMQKQIGQLQKRHELIEKQIDQLEKQTELPQKQIPQLQKQMGLLKKQIPQLQKQIQLVSEIFIDNKNSKYTKKITDTNLSNEEENEERGE